MNAKMLSGAWWKWKQWDSQVDKRGKSCAEKVEED